MAKDGTQLRRLVACFLRTYLVAAAFNRRGMQNIGLVYAMEPGLEAIYPDPETRRLARMRYAYHYHSHLFWTPLLVGAFLSIEMLIARGQFPAKLLENVKNTTTYTLSGLGDSFFGGSLLVFWSLSACCLVMAGLELYAAIWLAVLFVLLQIFKLCTFIMGLMWGLKSLHVMKGWDLIDWGQRIKCANAVLAATALYLAWPAPLDWSWYLAGVLVLSAAAWLVARTHLSREILAYLALAALAGMPWAQRLWGHVVQGGGG